MDVFEPETASADCQTPTHFPVEDPKKPHVWNEWDLRREALKIVRRLTRGTRRLAYADALFFRLLGFGCVVSRSFRCPCTTTAIDNLGVGLTYERCL